MIMAMMKSSNTEWLGDIPAEWDVAQIGNYYELRNEKVSDYDFEPLSVTMKGIVPQLATAAKSDDHSNRKLVKKGDFVINSRSDRRGSCGISPLDGSVSLINIVMKPRGEMNPQYYNWLFHTEQFADEFYKWGHGIVDDLWTTRWQEMKKILIVAPSPDEQQAIADYLDETCSKIDEIIAEAKASIDEYKELRIAMICNAVTFGINGIHSDDVYYYNDYLPAVPKNWNIMKGKYILTPLSRDVKDDDGVVTCFRDGEVTLRSNRRETGFTNSIKETGYQGVEPGDLVVHGMDGFAGAIGISDSRGKMSPIINVLDSNQNKKYVMYYLRNLAYKDVFLGLATGIRERSCDLRWNKLADLEYLIPSKTEQQEIVEWLDEYMPKYDSLIAEKESLIKDLEAYKKSLIYEVVTGKRRVV